ncbi:kelch-like protein 4 [Galleria mellonella]|uniref:Kelch-like protein 4 n=1 Tax=Galleria mellonella TaxID=7137 RepID=A0A6J1WX33_GALME|nr:kelch-like protein 4 [Galleria mellonella]
MNEMEEVSLVFEGEVFKARKDMLCEHSDYFRAMFSGSYVENEQQEIKIDVVDANSMKIILSYMEIRVIDLFEFSLSTLADLAVAANFLQITELITQIEHSLESQINISNWMEIMMIAENSLYVKLHQLSAAFGLLSFKNMQSEYVPSLHKLYWYLSHPYLDVSSELDVFKFGLEWISNNETGADALLITLCCLDIGKLKTNDLKEMKTLVKDYSDSLGAKVIDCLLELSSGEYGLCITAIENQKVVLCEMFTERVYNEVMNLVKDSRSRINTIEPIVPVWVVKDSKSDLVPHFLYKFSEEKGFEKWLEVAEKNLWGWHIVAWGLTKLIVICGEHGRGTGMFMRDVKVYDTLRKEWSWHGVELPARRHAGVAVVGDSMYIIGGVGGFRVVLDTAIIYDLKKKTFRNIAKLPDSIQNPAVCSHDNMVYAAGHKDIYRYEEQENTDSWVKIANGDVRMSYMISYKNYIYCMQNYFSHLHRFMPGVDEKLQLITYFSNPPSTACNLGNRLVVFTRTMCGLTDILTVEEYTGQSDEEKPKLIWSQSEPVMVVNDVAGSCSLVLSIPPLDVPTPSHHKRYLGRYNE